MDIDPVRPRKWPSAANVHVLCISNRLRCPAVIHWPLIRDLVCDVVRNLDEDGWRGEKAAMERSDCGSESFLLLAGQFATVVDVIVWHSKM